MLSKMCNVVGHRRHKKLARPHLDTWRSECVRCGVPMVRSAPGLWTDAPSLREQGLSGPRSHDLPSTHYPDRAKPNMRVHGTAKAETVIDHRPFACDLASALAFERNSAPERTSGGERREHYLARGAECRRLAEAASDRSIELIHLDMATRYDILARSSDDERRPLHSVK